MRVFVEGIVIVGSILLAFGIEAGWEARGDRVDEQILLEDLQQEFADNRQRLAGARASREIRLERLDILIGEAGPNATGISADSLKSLQELVWGRPNFDPARGVAERSGAGLTLMRDPRLQGGLAGFWDQFDFYFRNQSLITNELLFTPPVVFGSGTLVFTDYPPIEGMGATELWSDPLTPEQAIALKYWVRNRSLDELLLRQDRQLLAAIDFVLDELEWARSR